MGITDCMSFIEMRDNHKGFAMLQTVCKNFEGFTRKQVNTAFLACKAQAMMDHPTYNKFKEMVRSQSFTNCTMKIKDITNANAIFCPSCSGPKMKTVN